MELKKIDFNPSDGVIKFVGKSGRLYFVQQSLSVGRYPKLLVFEKSIQYNRRLEDVDNDLLEVEANFNKQKLTDAIVGVREIRNGVREVMKERSHVLLACGLFCNERDEDISKVDLDRLDEKVGDWIEYDFADFFALVAIMFPSYLEAYNQLTQAIMEAPAIQDLV